MRTPNHHRSPPKCGRVAAVAASVVSVAVASVALAAAWGSLFSVMAALGRGVNA
jgi:hypothetical protein